MQSLNSFEASALPNPRSWDAFAPATISFFAISSARWRLDTTWEDSCSSGSYGAKFFSAGCRWCNLEGGGQKELKEPVFLGGPPFSGVQQVQRHATRVEVRA